MSIKLGVAPIAWSNDDMPELGGDTSLEQCLQEASKAGFSGIESGGKFPKNSKELLPKLEKEKLKLCSGWYGAQLLKNTPKEEFNLMRDQLNLFKDCNAPCIVFAEVTDSVQGDPDIPLSKRPKLNDDELGVVTMKSKNGVICVITNSRHCSFGYDQRVELFGKSGMLISNNQKSDSTELFNYKQSSSQKPFLNFFIERYEDAYNLQIKELISLHENKIKCRSTFIDGYMALKLANAAYKSLRLKKTIKL